jgi:hypothetical protein
VRKAAIITVFAGIALLTSGIFTSCKTAKLPGTCNNDKEFRQDNGDDIRKGGTCGSGAKDYGVSSDLKYTKKSKNPSRPGKTQYREE